MSTAYAWSPYCGTPPSPAALWTTWRLDPTLVGVLLAIAVLYCVGYRRLQRDDARLLPTRWQVCAALGGWLIASLALVSPLCPLSVALFAARSAQHVLLTMLAAPLLVLARPAACLAAAFVGAGRACMVRAEPESSLRTPLTAAAAFAVSIWIWHMPAPYTATFQSTAVYWLMHTSLIGTSLWLWQTLLQTSNRSLPGSMLAGIASTVQMGLLGALITLAPRPLYEPHLLTTDTWGLAPLQDQQLGGVIMWVCGCTGFLVVALFDMGRALAQTALRPTAATVRMRATAQTPSR